jgi:hypothetical protein
MSVAITFYNERHHREISLFPPHISNHIQFTTRYKGRGSRGSNDFVPDIVSVLQDRFINGALGEDVVFLVWMIGPSCEWRLWL